MTSDERRTPSGIPIEPLYTPASLEGIDLEALGTPGEYPFARGVYRTCLLYTSDAADE